MCAIAAVAAGCGDDEDTAATTTATTTATGPPGQSTGTLADVPGIYRELEPSVVAIAVAGPQGTGEGSGIVYSADTVATNNHVIEGATTVRVVLASGERRKARIRARDPATDVAILTVEGGDLPRAKFAERLPPVGALAVAMGNPLGFERSVSAGIVSGVDREIPSGGQTPALVGLVQTDAAISPGNSGGALVGADRQVIGMNVAYIPPQARAVSIGFAIPSQTVTNVIQQLLEDGKAETAYLGTQLRPLSEPVAAELGVEPSGALVVGIDPRSPAAKAGIRPGDVIVEIAGREITIIEDVIAELREHEPGERVDVKLLRDGEPQTVSVRLAAR